MPALSFGLHVVKVEELVGEDGTTVTYRATLVPSVDGTGLRLTNPPTGFTLESSNPEDVAGLDCGFSYPVSLGDRVTPAPVPTP